MKLFSINRDSWHYRLNQNFLNPMYRMHYWEQDHNNFCAYWRATLIRCVAAAVLVSGIVAAIGLIGFLIYTNAAEFAGAMLGIIMLLTVALLLVIALPALRHRTVSAAKYVVSTKAVQSSIVVQAIRNRHAKICVPVTYDDRT